MSSGKYVCLKKISDLNKVFLGIFKSTFSFGVLSCDKLALSFLRHRQFVLILVNLSKNTKLSSNRKILHQLCATEELLYVEKRIKIIPLFKPIPELKKFIGEL